MCSFIILIFMRMVIIRILILVNIYCLKTFSYQSRLFWITDNTLDGVC